MLSPLLACPRCDATPLDVKGESYVCKSCKTVFPAIEGIPWLFADPNSSLGEWRERLNLVLKRLEQRALERDNALQQPDLLEATRRRLQHERDAYRDQLERLTQLMAPLNIGALTAEYATYLALRTRLPASQGLDSYYSNVHRDWVWGQRENEESYRAVADALDQPAGKTLVLGAGACRLAYDFHLKAKPDLTVALDMNPFLLLLAQQVMNGKNIQLYEFPIAPKDIEDHAVLRELRADQPVGENFVFVFGDALRAPFAAQSFDTVVTPWLIDIITQDFRLLAQRINRLLRPSGRWINTGSLSFPHRDPALNYSLEECRTVLDEAGFSEFSSNETQIPYLCSPASRQCRHESVVTFTATKQKDAKQVPRHKSLPDWIVTGDIPVPLTESFRVQAMSQRVYAFLMSMIDGKRTLKDMAALMAEQRLMTREEAEPAIRSFLIKMYDDAQRRSD